MNIKTCTSVKYFSFMNFNDRCGNKKKKNYINETIFSHMILRLLLYGIRIHVYVNAYNVRYS